MKSDGDRRNEVEPIDWGQGLYAAAQREVLEVLLNEPALFQGRQEEICVSLFNVPILRQIAEVLLDALRSDDGFSLSGLLARIESVSLAEGLVALQAAGEQKGNYASRLADAVSVLRRYRKDSQTIGLDQEGNEVRGVAAADGSGAGQNPHSLGLL